MLRLIQSFWDIVERNRLNIKNVGGKKRGVYILYKYHQEKIEGHIKDFYDVLYVGMANSSIRTRLRGHNKKKEEWTHFSVYGVWPNITEQEIRELEGLVRHVYRRDSRANALNLQRGYNALRTIEAKNSDEWKQRTEPFKLKKHS